MHDKKTIRKQILQIRKAMDKESVEELSKIICDKVSRLEQFILSNKICLYMPINNEVDTKYLIDVCFSMKKEVFLPKVLGDNMDFYQYKPDMKLTDGPYNILEPENDKVLIPDNKTLVVMPGAVFSEDCNRIGYGGGYYDRYLEKHPYCYKVAVCYKFQILDSIPFDKHDIKPDIIICEDT